MEKKTNKPGGMLVCSVHLACSHLIGTNMSQGSVKRHKVQFCLHFAKRNTSFSREVHMSKYNSGSQNLGLQRKINRLPFKLFANEMTGQTQCPLQRLGVCKINFKIKYKVLSCNVINGIGLLPCCVRDYFFLNS